jgi:hypothetical protein
MTIRKDNRSHWLGFTVQHTNILTLPLAIQT